MIATVLEPVRVLWRRRGLIRELTNREIGQRFTGSLFGCLWLVLQPLAALAVFAFVFHVVWGRDLEFVARLFCGLLVFSVFSESVARAPRLVAGRPNFVTKVVFPLEVLPVPVLVSSFVNLGVGAALLLGFQILFLDGVSWAVVLLPLVLVPLAMLVLGLSWVLSSIGVFVRDVHDVVRIVLQLLFFLSPIVWTIDMAPEGVRPFVMLNPLAIAIESARDVTVRGVAPDVVPFVALCLLSGAVMWAGHVWFRRTRVGFADVV